MRKILLDAVKIAENIVQQREQRTRGASTSTARPYSPPAPRPSSDCSSLSRDLDFLIQNVVPPHMLEQRSQTPPVIACVQRELDQIRERQRPRSSIDHYVDPLSDNPWGHFLEAVRRENERRVAEFGNQFAELMEEVELLAEADEHDETERFYRRRNIIRRFEAGEVALLRDFSDGEIYQMVHRDIENTCWQLRWCDRRELVLKTAPKYIKLRDRMINEYIILENKW